MIGNSLIVLGGKVISERYLWLGGEGRSLQSSLWRAGLCDMSISDGFMSETAVEIS